MTDLFILFYGGRLLASGTPGELRGMLADLPQVLWIVGPQVRELRISSQARQSIMVESLRIDHVENRAMVAVHKPLELYAALAEWSAEGIQIDQLLGVEGELQSLSKLLVSRHRGSRAKIT